MEEVTVTVTPEETPTDPTPAPTMEFLVGEMKAKLDQLLLNHVSKEQMETLEQKLNEIPKWTYEELKQVILEVTTPAEQVEEVIEEQAELIEDLVEVIEEEPEQLEEIPVVPEQVEQGEPEQATSKRRPWWL